MSGKISLQARFKINNPNVVHQVIGGETILINLQKGHYHSLDKSGTWVLQFVEKGASAEQICAAIAGTCGTHAERLHGEVTQFLSELAAGELILPDARKDAPASIRLDAPDPGFQFKTPLLQTFTDMEEFLLLDPIHYEEEPRND